MSDALAVFHGLFGRVCLYSLDRRMAPHGHRKGHLIFHVEGPAARVAVADRDLPVSARQAVAVSPWQPHYYAPLVATAPTLCLVLYIRPGWFLEAARQASATLSFGRAGIEVTDRMARLVQAIVRALVDPDRDDPLLADRLCELTETAFDQSWQWTRAGSAFTGPALPRRDYRIRNALRLLRDRLGEACELDEVARAVGLSRPHFYRLFRQQVGLTPNLYVNALRMERAIEQLSGSQEAVSEIGFDLGFSSQASFSRFFIANGVVPPSIYRRSVQTAALH